MHSLFLKALIIFLISLPFNIFTSEYKCRICNLDTTFAFEKLIRKKYMGRYNICNNCGSVQLQDPFWLNEVYSEKATYTDLDTGRFLRCQLVAEVIEHLKRKLGIKRKLNILDFGAGEGIIKKISHENIINYDPYFNYASLEEVKKQKYDLILCIEVMEHLENVSDFFTLLSSLIDEETMILCSTELVNNQTDLSWWYFTFDIGAHITFWSLKSFDFMKEFLDYQYVSHFHYKFLSFHLLSNKPLKL